MTPSAPPPPFDTEKAKREWLTLLQGVVGLAIFGGAAYFPHQELENLEKLGVVVTAVELAARQWSPDGVRALIDHGLTSKSVGVSGALVAAAANGAEPIIAMLLDAGADVNGRDRNRDTALAMARRSNNDAIVKLLVARGAREP